MGTESAFPGIPVDTVTAEAAGKPRPIPIAFPPLEPPPEPWAYPESTPVQFNAKFYPDPTERFIPKTGFLRDFYEARAGYETSPFFLLWGGLFTLAAVCRRAVGLTWGDDFLYPNLYVFLCSPPGTVKKATAINLALDCIHELPKYCEKKGDKLEAYLQAPNVLSGKGTAEALTQFLKPRSMKFTALDETLSARVVSADIGSQCDIIVPELTTFLNKSSYTETIVDKLTDLWDCRTRSAKEITIARGEESVHEVYVNMFAATTPDSLKDSLPEKAFGGGFVSRLCLIFVPDSTRAVPRPYIPEGYPVVSDVVARLYWCVKNAKGWGQKDTFNLSTEAEEAYYALYHALHLEIAQNQYVQNHAQNRLTQMILKVSLLVRMSRYEPGNEISLDDFTLAKRIMLYTVGQSKYALEAMGDSVYAKIINYVKAILAKYKEVDRRFLLRKATNRGYKSPDLDAVLSQLQYCDFLAVFSTEKIEGKPKEEWPRRLTNAVSHSGNDIYKITDDGIEEMEILFKKEETCDEATESALRKRALEL